MGQNAEASSAADAAENGGKVENPARISVLKPRDLLMCSCMKASLLRAAINVKSGRDYSVFLSLIYHLSRAGLPPFVRPQGQKSFSLLPPPRALSLSLSRSLRCPPLPLSLPLLPGKREFWSRAPKSFFLLPCVSGSYKEKGGQRRRNGNKKGKKQASQKNKNPQRYDKPKVGVFSRFCGGGGVFPTGENTAHCIARDTIGRLPSP